jgi:hydrogenase/urease accessory protein HupE
MAELVYVLCALTSIICAVLLFRGFRRSGTRLLFWSAWSFVGLALNNLLLFVDLILVPTIDLGILRAVMALIGLMVLVFGLIWESR